MVAALDQLWTKTDALIDDERRVVSIVDACKSAAATIDGGTPGFLAFAAGNAIACIGFAFMCARSKTAADAAWASGRAIDTVFHYVIEYVLLPNQKVRKLSPEVLDAVFRHPLYRDELAHQLGDIEQLKSAPRAVGEVRAKAQAVGAERSRLMIQSLSS